MTIAKDLAALWLDVEKEPQFDEPPNEPSVEPNKESLQQTIVSAVVAAAIVLGSLMGLALLTRWFRQ